MGKIKHGLNEILDGVKDELNNNKINAWVEKSKTKIKEVKEVKEKSSLRVDDINNTKEGTKSVKATRFNKHPYYDSIATNSKVFSKEWLLYWSGRINRNAYLIRSLVCLLLIIVIALIAFCLKVHYAPNIVMMAFMPMILPLNFIYGAGISKRLHDMGMTFAFAIVVFLANNIVLFSKIEIFLLLYGMNLAVIVILSRKVGDLSDNLYGPVADEVEFCSAIKSFSSKGIFTKKFSYVCGTLVLYLSFLVFIFKPLTASEEAKYLNNHYLDATYNIETEYLLNSEKAKSEAMFTYNTINLAAKGRGGFALGFAKMERMKPPSIAIKSLKGLLDKLINDNNRCKTDDPNKLMLRSCLVDFLEASIKYYGKEKEYYEVYYDEKSWGNSVNIAENNWRYAKVEADDKLAKFKSLYNTLTKDE